MNRFPLIPFFVFLVSTYCLAEAEEKQNEHHAAVETVRIYLEFLKEEEKEKAQYLLTAADDISHLGTNSQVEGLISLVNRDFESASVALSKSKHPQGENLRILDIEIENLRLDLSASGASEQLKGMNIYKVDFSTMVKVSRHGEESTIERDESILVIETLKKEFKIFMIE